VRPARAPDRREIDRAAAGVALDPFVQMQQMDDGQ
jgi:hypothetical protein